jgi:adenylate cyclase
VTIRTLTAHREVISSLILHYRGRVVYAPGDNLLAAVYSELGQAAEARAEVAEM